MMFVAKLKIASIQDDKPVTLTLKLPAATHRDLIAYAEVLKRETGQPVDPTMLIALMLARFMATDRVFLRSRRQLQATDKRG